MKRLLLLPVAVVVALAIGFVVAGCGSSSSTPEISKAEFIKQAEAVCEKGNKQIETEFAAYIKKHEKVKKPTEADYAELVEVVLTPAMSQEIDEFQELGAPGGEEDQVDAMVKAREESLKTAEGEPQLVIKDSEKVFGKASKLAKQYGLEACATR